MVWGLTVADGVITAFSGMRGFVICSDVDYSTLTLGTLSCQIYITILTQGQHL